MNTAQNQQSQGSFDSSVELNELQLTETTISLPQEQKVRTACSNIDDFDAFYQSPSKKSNNQSDLDHPRGADSMFIGFKNCWGMKQIKINESKLKKARQFFDDSEINYNYEQQYFNDKFPAKISEKQQEQNRANNFHDFQLSMPCFKTMGKGLEVKVSSQARNQVSHMFSDLTSIIKPTKMKKGSKFITDSMIKTNGIQSKLKEVSFDEKIQYAKQAQKVELFRKSFNWEQYEKQYKQEIQRQMHAENKKRQRRITEPKMKQNLTLIIPNKEYIFIKLFALKIKPSEEFKQSKVLAIETTRLEDKTFVHNGLDCQIVQCVLCKIKYSSLSISLPDLYTIMNKHFCKKLMKLQQFKNIYEQVCFKLLKYQLFWPQIINKNCHASNLIVEINKKLIQIQKQSETSYLKHCINKDQIGRKVNVIVKDKVVNQKMEIVFLRLSDGWFSVWAALESHNALYSFVLRDQKIHVGTKLSMCLWNIHPISNIIDFNQKAKKYTKEKCIEFYYNGSIILQPNSRLGFTPEQFYRPLNRCRLKGGLIPVTQGLIVRLFNCKQRAKAKKNELSLFSSHYAQILTPEGMTCLIKFVLNEQSSLVQFFRLYHCYHFFKLKINQDKMLSFLMDQSKFQQIKSHKVSQKQQIYPEPVCRLMEKRLVNNKSIKELKTDQKYDILCQAGRIQMDSGVYSIEIEEQKIDQGSVVYQQFKFISSNNHTLFFQRQKSSSQLRKIPKIYEKLCHQAKT